MFDSLRNDRQRASEPMRAMGNLPVPGTKAGAIVSLGLVILAWIAIPVARPFLLGTVGLGGLVGAAMWWRHSRE